MATSTVPPPSINTEADADLASVSMQAPVVAQHNNYLETQTAQFRSRSIPWEGYQRASLISDKELEQLRTFENGVPKNIDTLLADKGEEYALLFVNLASRIVRNDTLQNILILIDDILAENKDRALLFVKTSTKSPEFPYIPLLKLLKKDDEYVQLKAAKVLTFLLTNAPKVPGPPVDVSDLFVWLTNQLKSSTAAVVDLAVQFMQSLLSRTEYRWHLWETSGAISGLLETLRKGTGSAQMQYQIIYCFWSLTFQKEIAAELHRKYDVYGLFIDIAKAAIKEKVVRVVFATFKNLLVKAPDANLLPMFGAKLLNVCETLLSRKWADAEIGDDLEFIKQELSTHVQNLSTFDEYSSEVRSGKLDWSPPHLSENFWRQNAQRLNEKDHELIRILARLISTSTSPVVLAVAAHDLGQYVKFYPSGKKFIQEIGAKQQVMELMTHENPDVRYQALLAVQKFMTGGWEY